MSQGTFVLVVDDDEDFRAMAQLTLSLEGIDSTTSFDGADALDRLLKGLRVSVILLDVRMPRMNGFELLAALRAQPRLRSIPVIVLTGDTAAGERALASGARAVR